MRSEVLLFQVILVGTSLKCISRILYECDSTVDIASSIVASIARRPSLARGSVTVHGDAAAARSFAAVAAGEWVLRQPHLAGCRYWLAGRSRHQCAATAACRQERQLHAQAADETRGRRG